MDKYRRQTREDGALRLGPSEFSMEIADLDRLIKKYKFKDALPLAETLQTKLQG